MNEIQQRAAQIVAVNSPSHLRLVINNTELGREILRQAWERWGMSNDLAIAQQKVIWDIELTHTYEQMGLLDELYAVYKSQGNDVRMRVMQERIDKCVIRINELVDKLAGR